MIRVIEAHRMIVEEHRLRLFKRDTMLSNILPILLFVPLKPNITHVYSVHIFNVWFNPRPMVRQLTAKKHKHLGKIGIGERAEDSHHALDGRNYIGLLVWVFIWRFDQARMRGENVLLWLVPFMLAPLPTLMLFVLFLQRKLKS